MEQVSALLQFIFYFFRRDAHLSHHDQCMIEKICQFEDRILLVAAGCGNDRLDGFFADLFADLLDAFVKKVVGVGTVYRICFSVQDQVVKIL